MTCRRPIILTTAHPPCLWPPFLLCTIQTTLMLSTHKLSRPKAFLNLSQPHILQDTHNTILPSISTPQKIMILHTPLRAPIATSICPTPHSSPDVTLDSPPVRLAQTALPDALRPSVKSTPTTPTQWASTRFSVDSFYSGIVTDIPVSPGQAL